MASREVDFDVKAGQYLLRLPSEVRWRIFEIMSMVAQDLLYPQEDDGELYVTVGDYVVFLEMDDFVVEVRTIRRAGSS